MAFLHLATPEPRSPGAIGYPRRPMTTSPDRRIWIDGRLVPWAEATVHVLSHSHQRGSLVFDYMSVYETPRGPAVFRLDDHVQRMLASVQMVGLPLRYEAAAIRAAILETVRANPGAKAVKASAYLASVEVDIVPVDDHVTLAIAAYDPMADVLRPKGVTERSFAPLRIWVEKERKNRRPDILPPQAKVAANYASPMAAKWNAQEARLRRDPARRRPGLRRRGPDLERVPRRTRRDGAHAARGDGAPRRHATLDPRDRGRRRLQGGRGASSVPRRSTRRPRRSSPARRPACGRSRRSTTTRCPRRPARWRRSSARTSGAS